MVNASSEEGHTAVNGMSYSGRGGCNANSAVVVTVTPEEFGSTHPLAGIAFQRRLEEKAYAIGNGKIPVQRYGDYKECVRRNAGAGEAECQVVTEGREAGNDAEDEKTVRMAENGEAENVMKVKSAEQVIGRCGNNSMEIGRCEVNSGEIDIQGGDSVKENVKSGNGAGKQDMIMPQCKGMYTWADVSQILPLECNKAIVDGMEVFGKQIKGFHSPDVCMSGVESRTSSPVRILRDDSLQSTIRGLYPCGEGAGYAGGILSAAMDGLRVAEAIAVEYAIQ